MKKIEIMGVLIAIVMAAVFISTGAYAKGDEQGKGKTPKGKPFLELQGQIIEIQGSISTMKDQMDSIVAKVDTIEERVNENTVTIASLEAQNVLCKTR